MKYSSRILSLLALVSMAVFFAGCDKGEDNKKSDKDKQITKLKGTWEATANSVSFEGDPQSDYDNFSITLDGDNGDDALSYVVGGRPSGKIGPWNGDGELAFGSPVTSKLIRSDDLEITYVLSGANTLTLTFELPDGIGYTPGRTDEIEGEWVFVLTRQ